MSYSHAETWLKMITDVISNGEKTSPRGMPTYELRYTQHRTLDPLTFPINVHGREMRDVIGLVEGLSLVGEFSLPEMLTGYVKKFGSFMDGGILWGAYGARTHGQLGDLTRLLERDPDTRQGVITFFDAKRDLNRDKLDIPCTISGQFLLRDGEMNLGISMRSNDLWLGTPYDLMQFSILQASVAQAMGARMGDYHHRVGSLHLYAANSEDAASISWESAHPMPFPLWDPEVMDQYPVGEARMGAIQRRARAIALGARYDGPTTTQFEHWAASVL